MRVVVEPLSRFAAEGSQNETTDSDCSVVGYAAIGALTQSYMRRESVDEERYAIRRSRCAQGHHRGVTVRPGTHLRAGGQRPWDQGHGTRATVAGVVVEDGVTVER